MQLNDKGGLSNPFESTIDSYGDPFQVEIGSIKLGIRSMGNPDQSRTNPIEIKWSQENKVEEQDTPGDRPKTECTISNGLYYCTISFATKQKDLLEQVEKMKAGPHVVKTYFKTACMYLMKKDVTQPKGMKDPKQNVVLNLKEAYDA